jgi:IS30 family transposase
MKYKHFSVEEREAIQLALWRKESVRSIAKRLQRSPSSVAREITRNVPVQQRRYTPRLAHERALGKRHNRGRSDRLKSDRIRRYVITHLKRRWSPEQIAGRIGHDLGETISHEAIYQFIYAQVHRQGYGSVKLGQEDLRFYLRRRRKRRLPHGSRRGQRVFKPKGPSIEGRPKIVSRRSRVGDWEGDSVESCQHKPGLNTLVERKSGKVLMTKLSDRTAATTAAAVRRRFRRLPPAARATLTLDNGPENQGWRDIEAQTQTKCFFAHPYSSWERGSNENTNGLIRDYFPKSTDFTTIPAATISRVERGLNDRPRKRLGYLTPNEVFRVALQG